jgi:hypothetical protein
MGDDFGGIGRTGNAWALLLSRDRGFTFVMPLEALILRCPALLIRLRARFRPQCYFV